MKHTSTVRRFGSREIDTANATGLRADHPALEGKGRTLFPTTVVGSLNSPRFLVSGHNNPKLGKEVLKGDRKGWPIFHLTLEERATCPRTCEQWATCYGNAMPQSRRHAVDDLFLPLLRGEVATLARANPKGVLIRLHALGDFYSAEYVLAWAELLAMFPQVAVFGYTARRLDDADLESRKTAQAIHILTEAMWDRFAIRTSASDPIARSRSIVVDEVSTDPDVIQCPAQTGATEACSTCGLCWSTTARDKTIAFLRHGMTSRRGPRAAPEPVLTVVRPAPKPLQSVATPNPPMRKAPALPDRTFSRGKVAAFQAEDEARLYAAIERLADGKPELTCTLGRLGEASTIPAGSVLFVMRRLIAAGRVEMRKNTREGSRSPAPSTYRLIAEAVHPAPKYSNPIPEVTRTPAIPPRVMAAPKIGAAPLSELPVLPAERQPRPARAIPATDCPATPAPAPAQPLRIPAEFDDVWMTPDGPSGALVGLKASDCRWPTNSPPEGAGHLMTFCCEPAPEGQPYCPTHEARAHGKAAHV